MAVAEREIDTTKVAAKLIRQALKRAPVLAGDKPPEFEHFTYALQEIAENRWGGLWQDKLEELGIGNTRELLSIWRAR
jgi:hypothetical protein